MQPAAEPRTFVGVEFRILGPLQVWSDQGRVQLAGAQTEKLLAALLLAGGHVVSVDALIDALWDGEAPATAKHQIHKLVGKLRRRVPGVVVTDGPGYRVVLGGSTLDAATFARLAAVPTISSLTAALDLWRGPALAGIDSRTLRASAAALDERRLAVIEMLMDLRLAAGDAAAVAGELKELVAAHPLHEALWCRLMTALYHCGRTADALAAYAEIRALLAAEVGVDPGPDLIRLHQQVLRGDPALDPPARKAPCTLPYDLPDFHGRSADLDRLLTAADAVVINAIDGMAGIGKTALAVHAAHRLAPRYPDGQLFCDLHAHTPGAEPVEPATALELLLRMLGVPPEAIPDGLDARSAAWRNELAGRKVLVVLDNAATAGQVRPLLPGAPGCLALVTSRRRLGVLDSATVLSLDVLRPAEALELFRAVVGDSRTDAESEAATEVVRLCGYLPLAIRVAATRLAHRRLWTIASLVERLRGGTGRLGELTVQDRGVGPAFALSYSDLEPDQQRMFRLLGLHPAADFDAYSAAALADVPLREAERLLEALVDAHLLGQPAAGRYSFHDLLREYARELAPADRAEPRARLHDYYLAAATAATDLINRESRRFEPTLTHPSQRLPPLADLDAARSWLAAERAALVAVATVTDGWQLACVLRAFFEFEGHFVDWQTTHERALRYAAGDPLGTTLIHFNLGALAMWTGRLADSMAHFHQALDCHEGLGHGQLEAVALTSLGMLAHLRHQDVEATGYLRRALAIEHGGLHTEALVWNNLGLAEGRLGERGALDHHLRALALARRVGSRTAERTTLLGLGETSLRLGFPAAEAFQEAYELARAGRFRMQEALALDGLAHATGDSRFWRQALNIYADLGVSRADVVRAHLENPGAARCDLCRAVSPVDTARLGPTVPAVAPRPLPARSRT